MNYSILLVFYGFLALRVNGHVFVQESEPLSGQEVDRLFKILAHSRKQLSKQSSEDSVCSGEENMEKKDRDKSVIKKSPEDEKHNSVDDPDDDEYKDCVDKILKAVKKVLHGAPLFNPGSYTCGYKFTFKCQYTTRDDDGKRFFGFETTPGRNLLHITDIIDGFLSYPLVWTYARVLDQELENLFEEERQAAGEMRSENGPSFKFEELLQGVKRTVVRNREQIPQKFVCGFETEQNWKCSFEEKQYNVIFIGQFDDKNKKIQRMVRSEEFQQGVVKFAKEGSKLFPALKDGRSLSDNILAILLHK